MSSEWVITKLSEIGSFERGKSKHRPRDAAHLYSGAYPFIQTGDITASNGRITEFRQTYSEAGLSQSRLWPANTLCITIAANIAETALLTFPACFPDSVVGYSANPEKADVRFIEYLFRAFRQEIKNKAYGSVQENINLETLRGLSFPVPSLQTQHEIADVLMLFDDRITLLRETNKTLESIAQAIFKSWFVDFDPVRTKMEGRQPEGMDEETAALFPDSFEESELGLVPKGWRLGRISDLGDVVCGKTPPTKDINNYGNDVPFITIPDMHANLVITETVRRLSTKGADSQKKKYLPPGSVAVSCIATPGLVAQVTESSQTNQQINSVIPHDCWGAAFSLFLLQRVGNEVRTAGSGGSVFHNLNKSSFEKIKILLPQKTISQEFTKQISPFLTQITNNQHLIKSIADLRDLILPRLISGQLRLPNDEGVIGA